VYIYVCIYIYIYIFYVYIDICAKYSDFLCNLVEKMWLFNREVRYKIHSGSGLAGSGSEIIYSGSDSGSGKKFRIRPDPDSDPQHWIFRLEWLPYLSKTRRVTWSSRMVLVRGVVPLNSGSLVRGECRLPYLFATTGDGRLTVKKRVVKLS